MFGCALSIAGLYTTLAEWSNYDNELLSKVSTGLPLVFLISSILMWIALYVKMRVSLTHPPFGLILASLTIGTLGGLFMINYGTS